MNRFELYNALNILCAKKQFYDLFNALLLVNVSAEPGFTPMLYADLDLKAIAAEVEKGKLYLTQYIPKKNGASREISVPAKRLKVVQKVLSRIFAALYRPPACATGFISNRSIVSNASVHIGRKYVFNVDIADFFYSIERTRVQQIIRLAFKRHDSELFMDTEFFD
jgi:hypothetical protein